MPWPPDHRRRTRERIVRAAAARFRANGIPGVRVEDVMAQAGLTHGGFYAHFASKDDLVREALDYASGQTVERLTQPLAAQPSANALRVVLDTYLSAAHAAHPEQGCPIAALGPELARAGGPAQRGLARGLQRRLEWMRSLVPESERDALSDTEMIGTLAGMVGGVILARAAAGQEVDAILSACRTFLNRALDDRVAARRATRRKSTARANRKTPARRSRSRR